MQQQLAHRPHSHAEQQQQQRNDADADADESNSTGHHETKRGERESVLSPHHHKDLKLESGMLLLYESAAGYAVFKVVDESKLKDIDGLHKLFADAKQAQSM